MFVREYNISTSKAYLTYLSPNEMNDLKREPD